MHATKCAAAISSADAPVVRLEEDRRAVHREAEGDARHRRRGHRDRAAGVGEVVVEVGDLPPAEPIRQHARFEEVEGRVGMPAVQPGQRRPHAAEMPASHWPGDAAKQRACAASSFSGFFAAGSNGERCRRLPLLLLAHVMAGVGRPHAEGQHLEALPPHRIDLALHEGVRRAGYSPVR